MPASLVRHSAIAAVVGGLVTVSVAAVPRLRFAYLSTAGNLVLETSVMLVAALVAFLLYGRYLRSHSLGELLLVYALSLLGLTALVFVTLPGLLGEEAGSRASSWAALVVRLAGALLILAAALVPPRMTHRVTLPVREVGGLVLALGGLALTTYLLASHLPDAVDVRVTAESSGSPVFEGHPLVLIVQVVSLICYAVAAVVFTRRAARDGDAMLGWFGAAWTLGAWSRVAYLLFPSFYTDWLYVGDVLRLGSYALLLVGAVGEIRRYWEAQAALATESERRRLARELHDGVVQELGYIRTEARRSPPGHGVDRISAAADRGLDEARRAIYAMTAPADETLASALHQALGEMSDRYDVAVRLDLDDSVVAPASGHEDLVRLAREAFGNAARHARSSVISVTLNHGCLVVEDTGRGFDVSRGRVGGFGLTSMRDRAEAINASLSVESSPGRGTRVQVSW